MDFNKRIDDIIFKYNLDNGYPCYRKMKNAEKYLQVWKGNCLRRVEENEKILCIVSCGSELERFRFYTSQNAHFEYHIWGEDTWQENCWKKYKDIYIVSYSKKEEIVKQLVNDGVSFQFLYDYFAECGEEFDHEFYVFLMDDGLREVNDFYTKDNNYFLEVFFLKKRYNEQTPAMQKEEFLRRMLFLSLVFKDFLQAESYYQELLNSVDKDSGVIYRQLYSEVEDVLQEMKKSLKQRSVEKRDIIMMWLDQMKYGTEKVMPYLSEEVNRGVFFDNAHTLVPYTIPTFRALFTDEKDITLNLHSHKDIGKEESTLISEVEQRGYLFKVISGYITNIEWEWRWEEYLDKWAPTSLVCWHLLCCLLNSPKPAIIVVHEMSQTHAPFFSTQLDKEMASGSKKSVSRRQHYAIRETDQQLKFYMDFLHEDTLKIYMSDHGAGEPWERVHTFFAIVSKKIGRGRVEDIFTYRDFDKLMRQLMEERLLPGEFTVDQATIASLPLYNRELVKSKLINKRIDIEDLGYQGVVNKDYFYLKYNNGREVLLDRKNFPRKIYVIPHRADVCDAEKMQSLKNSMEDYGVDLDNEKFKYSKYIFKVFSKLENCQKNQLNDINKWIACSGKKNIAIRMGGEHSYTLYEWLSEDNQKKIIGFIDSDAECVCKAFGKKIIPIEKIAEENIDCIILSSFVHLDFIRAEAAEYPENICVFDLYGYLLEKGYPFKDMQCDLVGMPDDEYNVSLLEMCE